MSDIIIDSGVPVELVQRYTCYVCGVTVDVVSQLNSGDAMFWRPPAMWGKIGNTLVCEKHEIKLEVDGTALPDWSRERMFPRKVENG